MSNPSSSNLQSSSKDEPVSSSLQKNVKNDAPKLRKLSIDGDSDYEDRGPEDESLEMARRAYNQQLSDAFKDGFREGFDKGQIKLAQDVFNETHAKAARSQVPYGQYLGLIKVMESRFLTIQNMDSKSSEELKAILDTNSASVNKPMTRAVLLTRLKALREAKAVAQNTALVSLIKETESSLAKLTN
ncbi:uncharacterized protein LOC134840060 isoform X2 [Symsagittifera roscoffensis]|uniref:uncharacterized protein LOC134840060 isoform X2 n=1 Tax=Symsagittifera roscoffensis TaxID=84072 RepID=UPI00307C0A97